MKKPWFRLYSDFLTNPKIRALSFEHQRHFVCLLALKASGDLDADLIAQQLGIDDSIDDVKQALMAAELIDADWQPLGWDTRQFKSDRDTTSAERQRRYREKHRNAVTRYIPTSPQPQVNQPPAGSNALRDKPVTRYVPAIQSPSVYVVNYNEYQRDDACNALCGDDVTRYVTPTPFSSPSSPFINPLTTLSLPPFILPPISPPLNPRGFDTASTPSIPLQGEEVRKAKVEISLPDWLDADDWLDWLDHRKAIRKPVSDRAKPRVLAALSKLRDEGHAPDEVIQQSIANGWQGLFPLRARHENGKRLSSVERIHRDAEEIYQAFREQRPNGPTADELDKLMHGGWCSY